MYRVTMFDTKRSLSDDQLLRRRLQDDIEQEQKLEAKDKELVETIRETYLQNLNQIRSDLQQIWDIIVDRHKPLTTPTSTHVKIGETTSSDEEDIDWESKIDRPEFEGEKECSQIMSILLSKYGSIPK